MKCYAKWDKTQDTRGAILAESAYLGGGLRGGRLLLAPLGVAEFVIQRANAELSGVGGGRGAGGGTLGNEQGACALWWR